MGSVNKFWIPHLLSKIQFALLDPVGSVQGSFYLVYPHPC